MGLSDRGLVARYYVDEAASGQGPSDVLDSTPSPVNLNIKINGADPDYIELSTGRGLENAAGPTGIQGAISANLNGGKFETQLQGEKAFTMVWCGDMTGLSSVGPRWLHIGQGTANDIWYLRALADGNEIQVFANWAAGGQTHTFTLTGWSSAGRLVLHFVCDSAESTPGDRMKVFHNGSGLTRAAGTDPGIDDTLNMETGIHDNFLGMLNRDGGGRAGVGSCFYAAFHAVAFTSAEVTSESTALLTFDDPIPVEDRWEQRGRIYVRPWTPPKVWTPEDWTPRLVARGLVCRYFIDEAGSGQGPTQLEDSAPDPLVCAITYDASRQSYAEVATGRGFKWTVLNDASEITSAAIGSGKVFTRLDGNTAMTMELVIDFDDVSNLNTRFMRIGNDGGNVGSLTLGSDDDASEDRVRFHWQLDILVEGWDIAFGAAGRIVLHVVLDTSLGTAGDRIKLYKDGVLQTRAGIGTLPTLNETISLVSTEVLGFTRPTGASRSGIGTTYYGALYDVPFTQAEVTHDKDALLLNDDLVLPLIAGGIPVEDRWSPPWRTPRRTISAW